MDQGNFATPTRCLVVGASHEAALRDAWQPERWPQFDFINFWSLHFSGQQLEQALKAFQAHAPDTTLIAVTFGSNAHNRACLIESPEPFATVDASGDLVPRTMGTRRFIPRDLFRAHLKAESAIMLRILGTVHAAFPHNRFAHLCSPPPVLTMPEVADRQGLTQEQRDFMDMLDRNPPPPALRMEAFTLQTEVFEADANRRGASFLHPPRSALTPEGFLAPGFVAHGDPSHANAAYGALVLDQISAQMTGSV